MPIGGGNPQKTPAVFLQDVGNIAIGGNSVIPAGRRVMAVYSSGPDGAVEYLDAAATWREVASIMMSSTDVMTTTRFTLINILSTGANVRLKNNNIAIKAFQYVYEVLI